MFSFSKLSALLISSSITVLALGMVLFRQPTEVLANDTVAHCNQLYEIGSLEHSACVNQVGNAVNPRCYIGDERTVESSCDNITNLTPVAPNCYSLTPVTSQPGNIQYTAQLIACPGVPGSPGTGFTPVDSGVECTPGDPKCCEGVGLSIDVNCVDADNPILAYAGGFINFLSGAVGLVVTIMLGIAGIQYMAAQGNPGQIEAARKRVSNAVIAFVTFIFMYAILQWLVPGGIF